MKLSLEDLRKIIKEELDNLITEKKKKKSKKRRKRKKSKRRHPYLGWHLGWGYYNDYDFNVGDPVDFGGFDGGGDAGGGGE